VIPLPDGWDTWDLVRAVNAALAVALVAAVAFRVASRWADLDVEHRYLWQALALFTVATGFAAVDLIGSGVPGGPRLVLFTVALTFGHAALHHGRRWPRSRTHRKDAHG